jgi:hypothetical protein
MSEVGSSSRGGFGGGGGGGAATITHDAVSAGISPQFWSHVPMTVLDVLNLTLRDGINCIVTHPPTTHRPHQQQQQQRCRSWRPVSKCLLVGSVVSAAVRRDGSMAYVLDDGTGFIDCVHWPAGDWKHDVYHLPDLDDRGCDDVEMTPPQRVSVGDLVRVFGKVECLALVRTKGRLEEEVVIREVQATLIEPVLENALAVEGQHWWNCIKSSQVEGPSCFLELLGPQIQSQVNDRMDLPAAADTIGSWRVFGTSCRCNLSYKDSLLYCHCQAKVEPLDPTNSFRDALLEVLLAMQASCTKKLVFTYKTVKSDAQLRAVAAKELRTLDGSSSGIIDKMFLNTFRALRHDGIVHLLNNHTDEYLLITRNWVLEPFVRSQLVDKASPYPKHYVDFTNAPPYLSRIHNDRILFIKRCIVAGANDSQEQG